MKMAISIKIPFSHRDRKINMFIKTASFPMKKCTQNAEGPNLACRWEPNLACQGCQARLSSFSGQKAPNSTGHPVVLGVHVDDVIGGGNETFDTIRTTVRKEFDSGALDVGNSRFKGRQISKMPNGEIVCDMEQYKHEFEQIEVSNVYKTKPERLLNSKEHTQFRGGVGSLGWFVDQCCPQFSFQLAELRRKQASPTVQDLLKLNKVIRAAKVIESKIKIRSIPVEHLRFMGVHDAGHANLEGGASQQGHLILAVHASITNCRVLVSVQSWQCKKIKRVVRSSLAAETCSMSTSQEHLDWMRTMWEQMTRGDFVLENYEQFFILCPSILVTDCKSLDGASHKEEAAPASTDKRLAI